MTMLVRGGAAAPGAALPTTATTGQVLQWNGSAWVPATPSASGTTPNATTAVPGLVQLAGDLAGTATAPTVTKINGATPATVATTGAYNDLTGRPVLAPIATSGAYTDLTGRPALAAVATSGAYTDLTGRPALAAVATSGSYGDLTNRPLLAPVATSGSYADLTGAPVAGPATYAAGKKTATSTTSTTAVADPELAFASVPAGTYLVGGYLYNPGAANALVGLAGGTATASYRWQPASTTSAGSTTTAQITSAQAAAVAGFLVVTVAGSVTATLASSSGSTATLAAGSSLTLIRTA